MGELAGVAWTWPTLGASPAPTRARTRTSSTHLLCHCRTRAGACPEPHLRPTRSVPGHYDDFTIGRRESLRTQPSGKHAWRCSLNCAFPSEYLDRLSRRRQKTTLDRQMPSVLLSHGHPMLLALLGAVTPARVPRATLLARPVAPTIRPALICPPPEPLQVPPAGLATDGRRSNGFYLETECKSMCLAAVGRQPVP